ncbi:MAG: hypothetical protein IT185_06825 [Acidobacteria bacterium]|nr:hypothetical protein [Acidobacteriota bacterium]
MGWLVGALVLSATVLMPVAAQVQAPPSSYALYLPSQYRPDRAWPVLMAFHPSARGQAFVDLYRDVAEDYGYIIAASNVSRNGPWEPSLRAASVMAQDVGARYSIDPARVYTTGFSGGARVAMQLALQSKAIVGVIASGAGFPDAQVRKTLPFDVTATIGQDDFNYAELRTLDRGVASPHRVWYFDGGHTLPPAATARQAVEWLELRAMVRGLRPRDPAVVERWWLARLAAVEARGSVEGVATGLAELVEDFKPLRDVAETERRAQQMLRQPDVKRALARERDREVAETRELTEVAALEAGLRSEDTHTQPSGTPADSHEPVGACGGGARITGAAIRAPDTRCHHRGRGRTGQRRRISRPDSGVPRFAVSYFVRSSSSVQRWRSVSRSALAFSSAASVSAMTALPDR